MITSVQHGWILGNFYWKDTSGHYDSSRELLTALLDLDQVVFTFVVNYLESYKELEGYRDIWKIDWHVEVAEAVRQLIELSHHGVQSIFTRRIPAKQDNSPGRGQVLAGRSGFIRIEEGKEPGWIYEIRKETVVLQKCRCYAKLCFYSRNAEEILS